MSQRAKTSSTMMITGNMKTNIQIEKSKGGVHYGRMLVSGNNFDYSILIFDEQIVRNLNTHARKGTEVFIIGNLTDAPQENKNPDYNPTLTIKAQHVQMTSNFGAKYVEQQDAKQAVNA